MHHMSRIGLTERRAHAQRSYEAKAPEQVYSNARIVREVSDYLHGRQTDKLMGRNLEIPLAGVSVDIWPIKGCSEHILLFRERRTYLYWEAVDEPLERCREIALQWLVDPPVELAAAQ